MFHSERLILIIRSANLVVAPSLILLLMSQINAVFLDGCLQMLKEKTYCLFDRHVDASFQ
ncbi:MAG TPA: hypothetical protein DCP92_12685 [Nitrospiraceae bacterium]|nr:hypothetical protein [Nitrospiraceae bacterium]